MKEDKRKLVLLMAPVGYSFSLNDGEQTELRSYNYYEVKGVVLYSIRSTKNVVNHTSDSRFSFHGM